MPIFSRKSKPVRVEARGADADRTRALGLDLLERARAHKSGVLSARFYSDKLMNWSMKDHHFKVNLFRFVDAFPTLTTPEMVHDHLTDYLAQPGVKLPPGLDLGLKAGGIAKNLAASTISKQIKGMAEKFIAGTDAASALPRLEELWKSGIAFSVDLLGEACVSDNEADHYLDKYLDLVSNLPDTVGAWAPNERLETDYLGPIPRTNVSIKISSLSAKDDPIDFEGAIEDLMARLVPILERARDKGVFINFDMESFATKDLTIELFKRCCERVGFRAGLAMQAYLKSGVEDARNVAEWAKRTGRIVSVRLVKGAYWDYEVIHAEQEGWPCPVWNEKWETDACFEDMTDVFLDAIPRSTSEGGVKLALGSHNARSIAYGLAGLEARDLPRNAIELQMLHGMADQLKFAATDMGLRVREYVPVGEMIPGMAYLVRRLLENTSNESWLKAGFLENLDPDALLADPRIDPLTRQPRKRAMQDLVEIAPERHQLSPAHMELGEGKPFYTEPMRDFADAKQRAAFAKAVASCRLRDEPREASLEDTDRALARAYELAPTWREFDPVQRSRVVMALADAFRASRDELSAEIILENGKDWRNADADVTEAIDFCDYYARSALSLFKRERLGRFIGELDELWHQPRGVAVVIAPWNFPLAIACGMTTAALVTGNAVILKPAEQTPRIAARLVDLLRQTLKRFDAPEDVVQLLSGPGETIGAKLVRDERVDLIAFTGSRDVGLDIVHAAAPDSPFDAPRSSRAPSASEGIPSHVHIPPHIKKVIAEMGGKNAIIIDASADLDEAVLACRASAFGFQGQKCSACSRIIVVDPSGPDGTHTRTFLERFNNSMKSLVIGDPCDPGTDVGPVIDQEAADKINGYIERAKSRGLSCATIPVPDGLAQKVGKPYVAPHVFMNVPEDDELANEEIFGPVVAVLHAKDFNDALRLANASPYKLTGGVFTRKPRHIEEAKRRFRVGNLYINRTITGALVGRQPFGGFGMSGIGSKAGGAEYLLQFVEPRASCENTMRRGFAPEL